eukprot:NODE_12123_length_1244_cov_18.111907.p1 GENE.NODE_12123_length_1244_cov_18.111907~~NODE_12123_length_1244_cov_18.111907.p1  ORF type:complete len:377 (-),score=151.61 NODE_12123_length_1244_cov_18.111907:112-1242(-)
MGVTNGKDSKVIVLPKVCTSPLRPDIVRYTHAQMCLNDRMPHAVKKNAGYDTAAESWGTGRAVARVPRVPGGGTHRAGQGAFGNMCRGGGMFAPIMIYRKWGRRVPRKDKRNAIASAIAGSCVPALVMARGHRVDQVPEVPLVISNDALEKDKTKQVVAMLKKLGCEEELDKVKHSRKMRAGKGKMRNRRWTKRCGLLLVFHKAGDPPPLRNACRNIPGVTAMEVDRLNLKMVAPGGNLGRFIIWTEDAFKYLTKMYEGEKVSKTSYNLRHDVLTNADVQAIINSDAVQEACRPKIEKRKHAGLKANPLANKRYMTFLDPSHNSKELRAWRKSLKSDEPKKKVRNGFFKSISETHGIFKKLRVEKKAAEEGEDNDE